MKYTYFGFSQARAVELDLDLVDLAILRYFIDFKDSGSMVIEIVEGEPYYWVRYENLREANPILGINSNRALSRRLKKLIDSKVLKKHLKKKGGTYTFYAIGENYKTLIDSKHWTKKSCGTGLKSPVVPDPKVHPKDSSINNSSNNNSLYSACKESTTYINNFFEDMWKLYPNKKNKGQVSKSKKKEIYKLGEEFRRCIDRYIKDVEEQRRNGFSNLRYKNGSTFFNSGYIDYLDENYQDTLDSNKANEGGNNGYKGGITEDKTEGGDEINFAELAGIKEF